jgi:hypothetical protein
MKKLLVTLAALLVSASSFAQGTLIFNNRTQQGDRPITYGAGPNAGLGAGSLPGAFAQLYLVTGAAGSEVFTPLTPTTPFRTGNAAAFFTEVNPFTVPGVQPGESARFQVRAWQGAATYDAALTTPTAYHGASAIFAEDALGGTPPGGGLPVPNPTPDNLVAFQLVPEPSTMALGVLGAAALLFRRRK